MYATIVAGSGSSHFSSLRGFSHLGHSVILLFLSMDHFQYDSYVLRENRKSLYIYLKFFAPRPLILAVCRFNCFFNKRNLKCRFCGDPSVFGPGLDRFAKFITKDPSFGKLGHVIKD